MCMVYGGVGVDAGARLPAQGDIVSKKRTLIRRVSQELHTKYTKCTSKHVSISSRSLRV